MLRQAGQVLHEIDGMLPTGDYVLRAACQLLWSGFGRRFVIDSGQYAEMETGGTALAFVAEAVVSSSCPGFRPNRADAATAPPGARCPPAAPPPMPRRAGDGSGR